MEKSWKEHYFIFVKISAVGILMAYMISFGTESFRAGSLEWFCCAVYCMISVLYEMIENPKRKFLLLIAENLLAFLLLYITTGVVEVLLLLPIGVLDLLTYLKKKPYYAGFLAVFVLGYQENTFSLLFSLLLLIALYYQHYEIVNRYTEWMKALSKKEFELKEDINQQRIQFKQQITQKSLTMENRMLEERNEIYQQLHDKLGHNINGSVYQLEAAKVLLKEKPDDSQKLIQGVIDKLRTSMDEIRMIFRRQKPSKKQMAVLSLNQLCEECQEKYGIQASFEIEGEDRPIPETVLDIILDNSYEAVSNALKYSGCTKIDIRLVVMNQLVRCTIVDNGKGCETIKPGMGLAGMKERMRKAGAILNLDGRNGFQITMLFPIEMENLSSRT